MEERAILIVGECVVDLLIPQYASTGWLDKCQYWKCLEVVRTHGDVDQLDPISIAHRVISKNSRAL